MWASLRAWDFRRYQAALLEALPRPSTLLSERLRPRMTGEPKGALGPPPGGVTQRGEACRRGVWGERGGVLLPRTWGAGGALGRHGEGGLRAGGGCGGDCEDLRLAEVLGAGLGGAEQYWWWVYCTSMAHNENLRGGGLGGAFTGPVGVLRPADPATLLHSLWVSAAGAGAAVGAGTGGRGRPWRELARDGREGDASLSLLKAARLAALPRRLRSGHRSAATMSREWSNGRKLIGLVTSWSLLLSLLSCSFSFLSPDSRPARPSVKERNLLRKEPLRRLRAVTGEAGA